MKEAHQAIDRWLEHDPDNTIALMLRGKLYEQRDQTSEALDVYRHILEIDAEHDQARLRLTTILLQMRGGEEALPHLELLHRRLPQNADVQVQLAQALDLRGRAEEARRLLDECLHRQPYHSAALAERGRILRRDGDPLQAEEDLRLALRLDPGNTSARDQFVLTLGQNGKDEEAAREQESLRRMEADIKRIHELVKGQLQQTPNDPALHYEVAMIALRAGQPQEGLRWLLSALQIDPNHLPTHRALVAYYRETGNTILASRHRGIAQQLESRNPQSEAQKPKGKGDE